MGGVSGIGGSSSEFAGLASKQAKVSGLSAAQGNSFTGSFGEGTSYLYETTSTTGKSVLSSEGSVGTAPVAPIVSLARVVPTDGCRKSSRVPGWLAIALGFPP
jgi:hypothetical protein